MMAWPSERSHVQPVHASVFDSVPVALPRRIPEQNLATRTVGQVSVSDQTVYSMRAGPRNGACRPVKLGFERRRGGEQLSAARKREGQGLRCGRWRCARPPGTDRRAGRAPAREQAATPVIPEPQNGSSTRSPGSV